MISSSFRKNVDGARRVLSTARRKVRALRDRMLRSRRHRRALEQLRALGQPRVITVICHGNVCRSPYLEAVLRRELMQAGLAELRVTSAGFVGPGRQSPALARECARSRGLDLEPHRSQLLSAEILAAADLVIVMDALQRDRIRREFSLGVATVLIAGDLDPSADAVRAIPDPWGKDMTAFEESYARLDRCARVLVRTIRAHVEQMGDFGGDSG